MSAEAGPQSASRWRNNRQRAKLRDQPFRAVVTSAIWKATLRPSPWLRFGPAGRGRNRIFDFTCCDLAIGVLAPKSNAERSASTMPVELISLCLYLSDQCDGYNFQYEPFRDRLGNRPGSAALVRKHAHRERHLQPPASARYSYHTWRRICTEEMWKSVPKTQATMRLRLDPLRIAATERVGWEAPITPG